MTNNLWDWDSRASIPTVPCLPYPPLPLRNSARKRREAGNSRSHVPTPQSQREKPSILRFARLDPSGKFTIQGSHTPIPPGLPPLTLLSTVRRLDACCTRVLRVPLCRAASSSSPASASSASIVVVVAAATTADGAPPSTATPLLAPLMLLSTVRRLDACCTRVLRVPFVAPLTLSLPSLTPEGCCILVP
ncbi:hypothetical protein EDB89DRAFT_2066042 [Lactarius sanguifluus]|nr:hypothetical protein EDB89DRAFT_2066042 [Lactarius sanguifluus]